MNRHATTRKKQAVEIGKGANLTSSWSVTLTRFLATATLATLGSFAVSQPIDSAKLSSILSESRRKLPSIDCEIREKSGYFPESKAFYRRDLADWDSDSTYRWAYSKGAIAREGSISSQKGAKSVRTREVFDGKATRLLATSSRPGPGREGQGLLTDRDGLDSRVDLLHCGFKVSGEWIDDLVRQGRFKASVSTWKYKGSPTIELSGLNEDHRPTKVWLSEKHDLVAVRCVTTQSDNTELYYEPTELTQIQGRWFPTKGKWGVQGSQNEKLVHLMEGTLEGSDFKEADRNSDLLANVEFPEKSLVANADTGRYYRVENGKLVEFDPRAQTRAASMLPGWLFIGGALIFLGVITRVFLAFQHRKNIAR